MITRKEFGRRLKISRELEGYTQASVAERSGLDPTAINHFEKGRRMPSLGSFYKLAKVIPFHTFLILDEGANLW